MHKLGRTQKCAHKGEGCVSPYLPVSPWDKTGVLQRGNRGKFRIPVYWTASVVHLTVKAEVQESDPTGKDRGGGNAPTPYLSSLICLQETNCVVLRGEREEFQSRWELWSDSLPFPLCWRVKQRQLTRIKEAEEEATKCPSMAEWINKIWYIHTMECFHP